MGNYFNTGCIADLMTFEKEKLIAQVFFRVLNKSLLFVKIKRTNSIVSQRALWDEIFTDRKFTYFYRAFYSSLGNIEGMEIQTCLRATSLREYCFKKTRHYEK